MLTAGYTGCVYLATNTANGRAYIGKTLTHLSRRRTSHHVAANAGKGSIFHAALRKHGFDAFEWQTLFESDDEQLLFAAEIALIEDYRRIGVRLYNVTPGGDGVSVPCTEERRQKLKISMKGRIVSPESRQKMSDAARGKPKSPAHIEKVRAGKIGVRLKPWSAERRLKMEAAWANWRSQGRTISDETRAKMSAAAKRRCAR